MPRLNIATKETSLKRVKKILFYSSAQIILFFKMLKFSKKYFSQRIIFLKEKKNILEYSGVF
jgi:hypothetical protein